MYRLCKRALIIAISGHFGGRAHDDDSPSPPHQALPPESLDTRVGGPMASRRHAWWMLQHHTVPLASQIVVSGCAALKGAVDGSKAPNGKVGLVTNDQLTFL